MRPPPILAIHFQPIGGDIRQTIPFPGTIESTARERSHSLYRLVSQA